MERSREDRSNPIVNALTLKSKFDSNKTNTSHVVMEELVQLIKDKIAGFQKLTATISNSITYLENSDLSSFSKSMLEQDKVITLIQEIDTKINALTETFTESKKQTVQKILNLAVNVGESGVEFSGLEYQVARLSESVNSAKKIMKKLSSQVNRVRDESQKQMNIQNQNNKINSSYQNLGGLSGSHVDYK